MYVIVRLLLDIATICEIAICGPLKEEGKARPRDVERRRAKSHDGVFLPSSARMRTGLCR